MKMIALRVRYLRKAYLAVVLAGSGDIVLGETLENRKGSQLQLIQLLSVALRRHGLPYFFCVCAPGLARLPGALYRNDQSLRGVTNSFCREETQMRLIVHGQQAFGQSVLEKLIERGEDIVGVYVAPDKGKPDPLKVAAEEAGLPVFQPTTYKEPEVWDQMKSLSPDLCVMAFVTLFVPEEALYLPTHDSIQYHPSLLPLHRGPSAINWPIIMGRKETGLSIFWPDNGLDEGPILLQKTCTIEENDTLGTVYFDKLFPMGVDAMMESVDLVKQGNAPRIDQDHSQKTYESWCRKADVELDFTKPMQEVHNMIRGADPVPGAWTTCGGAEIQLYGSTKAESAAGAPGEIVDISSDGMVIACGDGGVNVTRVRGAEGKVAASDFAASAELSAGAKLG